MFIFVLLVLNKTTVALKDKKNVILQKTRLIPEKKHHGNFKTAQFKQQTCRLASLSWTFSTI